MSARRVTSWCGLGTECADDPPCDVHALVADNQQQARTIGTLEAILFGDVTQRSRDELGDKAVKVVAENQQLRDALERYEIHLGIARSFIPAARNLAYLERVEQAMDARSALAGTPSEDTE